MTEREWAMQGELDGQGVAKQSCRDHTTAAAESTIRCNARDQGLLLSTVTLMEQC